MDFLEKVEQYIREKTLFSKEDRVFVACSGGVDSLTLLYCLHALGYRVTAGHVHHGLRQTADRDEAHVKEWAEDRGIPCYTARVDVPARVAEKGESVEEAARNLRYEALLSLAEQAGCSVIALAQHADDHLETVLFHLIRGSGIRGVCGMAPKTVRRTQNSGHFSAFLVRPFLFATKEEIAAYAANIGLTWVEDETNQSDDYTRNKLRHTVIPTLKEIRRDSAEKALETAEILSSADAYLQ